MDTINLFSAEHNLTQETLLTSMPLVVTYNKAIKNLSHHQPTLIEKNKGSHNDTSSKTNPSNITSLNIYIEGDGNILYKPLFSAAKASKNPTSTSTTALKLMSTDSGPSLYLSRPCYGAATLPKDCNAEWWTSGRYSKNVVKLMNQALTAIKNKFGVDSFNLIGHSGGGVIAVILASKRDDISGVITISSNIDHELWTSSLGYKNLENSLNAVDFLPLPVKVKQLHLVGEKDTVVPARLTIQALSKDKNATLDIYPTFTHTCCWETIWKETLNSFLSLP